MKMPTRRALDSKERPQERFLSDPAFVKRRGILANAVAAKSRLYRSQSDRSLLFFLQALSMRHGGIDGVAHDILTAFPARLRVDSVPSSPLEDYAQYLADNGTRRHLVVTNAVKAFGEFLERLCIDPTLDVSMIRRAKSSSGVAYFDDPIGAIEEFRERRTSEHIRSTAITSIGRKIEGLLDYAESTSQMVIIVGASGSGKTFAAESWCYRRCGDALFITLSGITHRTGLFQKISAVAGLAQCQQASSKLQARIETYLAQTRRMLVIDEAHFLWPQHQRSHSAPELIDWINTALVNNGVPVGLIATPQFAKLKTRCERQVGWNSDQLLHRTARFEVLPDRPSKEDLISVARNLLSCRWSDEADEWIFDSCVRADSTTVKLVGLYGAANLLPLGSIHSIVRDSQWRARLAGRNRISLIDIKQARDAQERSDAGIRLAFNGASQKRSESPPLRSSPAKSDADSDEQMSNLSRPRVSRLEASQVSSRRPALT